MKAWHFILIGGALLIGGYFFVRSRSQSTAVPGVKLGGGTVADAGAPPLPNLSMANNKQATLVTFFNRRFTT